MRRPLLALLLALAVLAPAVPATAQTGDEDDGSSDASDRGRSEDRRRDEDRPTDDGRGRSGGAGDDDDDDDDDDGDDEDDRRRGAAARAERPTAVGAFSVEPTTQAVQGDYVSFAYTDTGVSDYSVDGTRLFDLTVASGGDDDGRAARARGAEVKVQTPFYELKVHDNPTAALKLETDGTAVLRFAEGANLTPGGEGFVLFALGDLTGHVRAKDVAIEDGTVTGSDEISIHVDRQRGSFDVHRARIGEGVARRAVGAEASFNRGDGGVEQEIVSYGNVTITTLKAAEGNLTLLVDGHGFDGRVLVLNVDGRILGADSADKLSVLFDNASIRPASGIQDVLDPDDDGLQAEYYVVFDPATQAFQMLVSVPHYSVHTLSIQSVVALPPPSVVAGLLAGVVLMAASGLVLFRRPKV